jgi:HD-GYP domain-containing protein (c-di-GMP phosphodiesterase class II)
MRDKRTDDIFKEAVARYGRQIINHFSILVKLTGIHDSLNEALVNAASRLLSDLEPFLKEEGELTLKMVEGSFFIENLRIKSSLSDVDNFEFLAGEFKKRGVGALTFKAPLRSDDLIFLAYSIKGGAEASEIQSLLESKLTRSISIGGPIFFGKGDYLLDVYDTGKVAVRLYTRLLAVVKEIESSAKSGKTTNMKRVKRVINDMVDNILKDESYILGLTTLKDFDNYLYNHIVNTAILSIAIGKRINLPKHQLSKLGMAALFHDIGKVEIPLSILNKPSEFDAKEWEIIMMHPVEGVKTLMRLSGLSELSIIFMLTCFEHHLNYDHTGYPRLSKGITPNLFSRIISIADHYDALTSGKVYGRITYSSEEALRFMYEKQGKYFDPVLIRAFINIFSGDSSHQA